MQPGSARTLLLAALTLALGAQSCPGPGGGEVGSDAFHFESPGFEQLSLLGDVFVEIDLPDTGVVQSLELTVDGAPVDPADVQIGGGLASATLPGLAEGWHTLEATAVVRVLLANVTYFARTRLELADLTLPDRCEVLNDVECLLPYPSQRFLADAPGTPNGFSLTFPLEGMPKQASQEGGGLQPVDPTPYLELDGYSPTVQILMHFPQGVDLAASGAGRLSPTNRSYDDTTLQPDSPTVLIDALTGERVLHFVEKDARVASPDRQIVFLRPARSLAPGRRYIVAVRDLVSPGGAPVEPEAPFRVLRDDRPSTLPELEARRARFEDIFQRLEDAGVARDDLLLAWDFTTQSEHTLSHQMLSMRDQSFAWLDAQIDAGVQTFSVDEVIESPTCLEDGDFVWREIRGTYQVPLFLTEDPELDQPRATPQVLTTGVLNKDADGVPVQNGFSNPVFTIAVPCKSIDPAVTDVTFRPILLGHGLFGNGRGFVDDIAGLADLQQELAGQGIELPDFDYIPGATDWRGLSSREVQGPSQGCGVPELCSWIASKVISDFDNFEMLPDRLRQGQLNTLVLARMMRRAAFNLDPAFQLEGEGVLPGESEPMYYFGASLGGIMGLMFSALTPDIEKLNVDVPGMNFSLLLQRATPFLLFQGLLALTGIDDPMTVALGLGLTHELWVRAEPAGYVRHITSDPFDRPPHVGGTGLAKKILMTEALYDQQVTNQSTEIAARTLGLPILEGSVRRGQGLVDFDEPAGAVDGAWVTYDTGALDPDDPDHAQFIPPLANLQATPSNCDPHGRRGFTPASLVQLVTFLQPGGRIENFCDGACDTRDALSGDPLVLELPFGEPPPEECRALSFF